MYYVYIIENPDRRKYIGLSENPANRLEQHNAGDSKWTKYRGPWTLIWTSEAMSITDARKLENLLKRQKGGTGLYKITGLSSIANQAPSQKVRLQLPSIALFSEYRCAKGAPKLAEVDRISFVRSCTREDLLDYAERQLPLIAIGLIRTLFPFNAEVEFLMATWS